MRVKCRVSGTFVLIPPDVIIRHRRGFWPARALLAFAIIIAIPLAIGAFYDHQATVARQEARAELQRKERQQQEAEQHHEEEIKATAARELAEQNHRDQMAAAEEQQRTRRAEAENAERERENLERPARGALLAYAHAKIDYERKKEYAQSLSDLADAVSKNMGATGSDDWSKLNKAQDDWRAAEVDAHTALVNTRECLDKLGSFNQQFLSAIAQRLVEDPSVDIGLRQTIAALLR